MGLGEHADLAELIVSELATNAIKHADGPVRVRVSYARGDLRVEAHDDGAGRPVRRRATADDESGRGLALLDELIGLCGGTRAVANDSAGHGKTVHVTVRLAAGGRPVTDASATAAHRIHAGTPPGADGPPRAGASCRGRRPVMCHHAPPCPPAHAPDGAAACIIAGHPEQGWNLLCNGIVLFEDTGMLLPDATVIGPHRAPGRTPAHGLPPSRSRPESPPATSSLRRSTKSSSMCGSGICSKSWTVKVALGSFSRGSRTTCSETETLASALLMSNIVLLPVYAWRRLITFYRRRRFPHWRTE
jgi:hypothetical protein